MLLTDIIFGTLLLSQLCICVLGNLLLFMVYVYTFLVQPHFKKPMDSIFMQLTMVNMLTVIFVLVPFIVSFFGVQHFLDDIGCKIVLYIFRVTRGVSSCTTAILSAFQAIIITPSNSKLSWIKFKLSTWSFPSLIFIWVINLVVDIHIIETVTVKTNSTHGNGYSHVYCQGSMYGNLNPAIFLSIILLQDLLSVVFFTWASLYMVIFLHRHRKRAQHIHSTSLSSHLSPEYKATHSILLLVSSFVFFLWISNFVTLYGFYTPVKMIHTQRITAFLTSCYPTICPFILMKNNKIVSQLASSSSFRRITYFQRALSD